jgi:Mg/Co/Ni transporter MgtE
MIELEVDQKSIFRNGGLIEVTHHVKNYMNKDFLTVTPQETLDNLARKMIKTGTEYAVVKKDNKLVGLVSADEIIQEVKSSIVSRINMEKFPEEVRSMLILELMNNPRTMNFMEACGFEGTRLASSIG